MMKNDKELLKLAKKRFASAQDAWGQFYRDARQTLSFIEGDQWDHQLKLSRESAGIPCLTANTLPVFLRQITNESRQNCPAIQVDPKDKGADKDTAQVLADLIRGIEQESNASTAYDVAGWYAAAVGLGYFRVTSEYISEDSFLQKLVIKQIYDPETVLLDPAHREADGSDSEYAFVVTTMTKDEYKRAYPDSNLSKKTDNDPVHGWSAEDVRWIGEDEVIIAEYYYKDYIPATLYQIYNSMTQQTIESTEAPPEELLVDGTLTVLNKRQVQECTIKWCKLNDMEVLDETTWPGKNIPIIAVKGDEIWINGKRKLKGAVKDAEDSQRALNYFFSLQAELVSLAPKAPYVGEIRQFENFEHIWRDANVAPSAYLPYNAVNIDGQVLGAPQRQTAEVPIQAAMSMVQQARDNIKGIFGIFDASIGQQGSGTEGYQAIIARQAQSHTTTYNFYDNLTKAVQHCGRILIEAIPTFYADERSVQLITRAGESTTTTINGQDETSRDITQGTYGVTVETGPSYATRRQDSVTHMIAMGGVYPQAMPLIADLIAAESDWPGSKEIAARLRMALPPQILESEAQSGQGIPPEQQAQQAIAQAQQLGQQVQTLTQQNQELSTHLKTSFDEIHLLKAKNSVDLTKATNDKEIKEKQLVLDELEAELSYKIKLREILIQEEQLKLERAKLAIEETEVAAGMNSDMHKHSMDHAALDAKLKPAEPLTGIDKSFQTLSGEDVGNA
jgi:hypothetical protein